jgi:hypothetical protein
MDAWCAANYLSVIRTIKTLAAWFEFGGHIKNPAGEDQRRSKD